MQTKKSIRIVSVLFSMTMMAGYVVHSQLQHSRSVAPSSKLGTLSDTSWQGGGSGTAATKDKLPTSNSLRAVAPGSKSLAPVLEVRPTQPGSSFPGRQIAPGSKSAAVFDFSQKQAPEKAALERKSPVSSLATNQSPSARP